MTAHHPGEQLLRQYVRGDDVPADQLWAVEAHLESCAPCRGRLAPDPIAEQVWADLAPVLDRTPQMPPARSWLRHVSHWVSPVAGPWLAMILLVTAVAVALDQAGSVARGQISLVLLVAPVLPVLGVAASWGRAMDPAHELTAATPRAGLPLVFRRTVAVLAVVVPGLLVASQLTGASLTQWMLPCLAFTTCTLALGGLIGITRAAITLIAGWAAGIVLPTIALSRTSVALDVAATPVWAAVLAAGLIVIAVRFRTQSRSS
ncbi:zf-HC2 domain-containing protein [Lentzea sp. NEAU-D13]|uniref:Zf-HC2 domain-containing protein n=1 Tax=Lentzea alba TaxID=2714351 RepID=A0A7C9W3R4_9PSEU|nr:zf-HC2 domain-containing protein [Lentzea alba]NGY62800.1 zf-HC2 domain-containing protein [Lentzea alba]